MAIQKSTELIENKELAQGMYSSRPYLQIIEDHLSVIWQIGVRSR